jgi:hypothetical protein
MRRALGGLALLVCVACDPDEPCELAAKVDDPGLVLGQGEEAFVRLDPGGRLVPEHGPQGGQHVWGALRATGISPGGYRLIGQDGTPTATIYVVDESSGDDLAIGRVRDLPWVGDHTGAEIAGIQAILSETFTSPASSDTGATGPREPSDRPVILRAEVTDECGTELEGQIAAVLRAE